MRPLVLFLAGGALTACIWAVSSMGRTSRGSAVGSSESRSTPEVDAVELNRLHERIAELEAQLGSPPATARRAAASVGAEAISSTTSEGAAKDASPAEPLPTSPVELLDVIRSLDPNDREARRKRTERSMELRERFLELFPDHPEAARQLAELVAQSISAQGGDALGVLERFGSRVAIEPWLLDAEYANVYSVSARFDEARVAFDQVIQNSSAPEHDRARALFFRAYTYVQEANYAEAKRAFEDLIAEYAEKTPKSQYANLVEGAKTQLTKIEEWSKQK